MNAELPKFDSFSLAPGPAGAKTSCLAWAGWAVWTPSLWRPLSINGGRTKGTLLIGDGQQAVAQIKWLQIKRKSFDESRWIKRRLRKVARRPYRKVSPVKGRTDDFQQLAWLDAGQLKRKSRSQTAIWYGFSQTARLLLEVVINAAAGDDVVRTLRKEVLASLRACPVDGPTAWSLFDTNFVSPAGFDVRNKRINLGDVALEFVSSGQRIVVRQVYPAQLALQRRGLEKWLNDWPFQQRRRFKAAEDPKMLDIQAVTMPVTATCRIGQKRLPFPLRYIKRRHSVAAVAQEPGLDRLMMAEYDCPFRRGSNQDFGVDMVSWLLGQMNWARRIATGPRDDKA